MKKVVCLFLLYIVCSCATTAKYERILNSWVGSDESELVDRIGPPDQVYENDGKKYITYIYSSTSYVPQTVHNTTVGNNIQTNVYGGYSRSWHCKTTYIIENKKIVSWRYDGNACVAK